MRKKLKRPESAQKTLGFLPKKARVAGIPSKASYSSVESSALTSPQSLNRRKPNILKLLGMKKDFSSICKKIDEKIIASLEVKMQKWMK